MTLRRARTVRILRIETPPRKIRRFATNAHLPEMKVLVCAGVTKQEMRGWSMPCYSQRASALTAGIWLIGLGLMIATEAWWPGILLPIGLTVVIQLWFSGRQRQAAIGGFLVIAIAAWAACKFNIAVLFVAVGAYFICCALPSPDYVRKPHVDNTLE
jgi:hypothetical protein